MSFGLEEIAEQNRRDVESAILEAERAKSDAEAQAILLGAIGEVRDAVSGIAVENVTVDNLDEISAALHNELTKLGKPIIAAIEKLNISKERIEKIKSEIESKNRNALRESHDIQIIKKPKHRFSIENLSDISFPESLKVANFEELKAYFTALEECIKQYGNIEIPVPQVTVNPPNVIVPEIRIPEQSVTIDIDKIIDALEPLKFISDRSNKPIAVRLSDGQKFIKAIETIVANQEKQVAAFSGGLNSADLKKYLRSNSEIAQSIGSGNKAVATAGTRVQLATSTPCKWVNIIGKVANTDTIWVGGSNVAAGTGQPIAALQSTDKLPCDNLANVWLDAVVNGEGVTYIYGA